MLETAAGGSRRDDRLMRAGGPGTSRIYRPAAAVVGMAAGGLLFALYVLAFSCCGVVQAPAAGSRGAALGGQDEDETRYQRALDDKDAYTLYHRSVQRKTLDEEQAGDSEGWRGRPEPFYPETGNGGGEWGDAGERVGREGGRRVPMVRTNNTAARRLPQAIVIGVKKSGTRALLEFLRIHPDIRAPGPETHFFDRNYDKGLEWYRRKMPPTIEGQLTVEKTPSYYITRGVPARIYTMSPRTRLIVVMRDPVTRAISDYTQALAKRPDIKPFEGMAFQDNSTGLVDTSWGAIKIGVYAKHLERWLQYFPLSQMHFVHGERLIKDPAAEMAKVQDFLGLKRIISDKHFYFNTTKGFPCLKKPEGSGRPHCLGKTKGRAHPQVDPKVLQRLRDFFRPFNQKFYQMVGQDFGWP